MKDHLRSIRKVILGVIDFFHRPFARWINVQTFRYLACGGTNALVHILVYWVAYNFIVAKQDIILTQDFKITAPIAAYLIAFSFSFPQGFILSRYIVFPESELRGRIQFVRYVLLVGVCMVLNYVLLKFFVEVCDIYPTPSTVLVTGLVAIFSYVAQRAFTFKQPAGVKPLEEVLEGHAVTAVSERDTLA